MMKRFGAKAGIITLVTFVFWGGFVSPLPAETGGIEIITDKDEYFPGEAVEFMIRGRVMFATEADGKIIYPPYSIWSDRMEKLRLRHSCAAGINRAYDQYCQDGVVKSIEVDRCPEAFFSSYGVIKEKFSWDQKEYVPVTEKCGPYTITREIKEQVPSGAYRIVVCGNIQSCVEKEIVIKDRREVSIELNKTVYRQGEPVKITIRNNLDKPLINYDWSLPAERDYSRKDSGWGYVEMFKKGSWIRVEPLWRCGGECFARCALGPEFFSLQPRGEEKFPGDFRCFEWNQMKTICLPKLQRKQASPGRYRVKSTFHDLSSGVVKTFYSEEFVITGMDGRR